jgi:hypothetical protein
MRPDIFEQIRLVMVFKPVFLLRDHACQLALALDKTF